MKHIILASMILILSASLLSACDSQPSPATDSNQSTTKQTQPQQPDDQGPPPDGP